MSKKTLFIPSFDFKPQLGGVANYVHELALSLSRDVNIHILARAQNASGIYDRDVPFRVHRVAVPETAILALPRWTMKVRKHLAQLSPDAVLCPLWFPDAGATYLAQVGSSRQIPYFITAHGMEIFDSEHNLKHRLRKVALGGLKQKIFSHTNKVMAVSEYTREQVLSHTSLGSDRVVTIPNGVNLERYSRPSSTHWDTLLSGKKCLLTVTRLHPYKGVDQVIRALPELKRQHENLIYVVVGLGPDQPRLEQLATELGVADIVHFVGAIPHEHLLELYARAALFVLLSREDLPDVEGFGLVFLEAAACGLASLGGRSGGIPDAIEEGRSGWLVDPLDVTTITQKLNELLKNSEDLRKAGDYGLRMVQSKTWNHVAERAREVLFGR